MSAINPASFASPTLGLQAPSGIGPGAVGVGRSTSAADRRQNPSADTQPAYPSSSGQAPRTAQSTFPQPFNPDRPVVQGSGFPPPSYPYHPYGGFGNASRPTPAFAPGMVPNLDTSTGGFAAQVGARYPSPSGAAQYDPSISPLTTQTDWVGAFQGLSLNTR